MYIKQIMDVFHLCNSMNNFTPWRIECSIQLGFASLNRTCNVWTHEIIHTIAPINMHYLYVGRRLKSALIVMRPLKDYLMALRGRCCLRICKSYKMLNSKIFHWRIDLELIWANRMLSSCSQFLTKWKDVKPAVLRLGL